MTCAEAKRIIPRIAFFVALLVGVSTAVADPDFSPVRSLLEESVVEGKVAGGSVLVLHQGVVIFEEGFGFADQQSKTPFQVDTPVVIASISKPLLGTAAYRLAEQGKVNLSAPISEYLPEFASAKLGSGVPLGKSPTMIELFSHTSGMRGDRAPGGRPWLASWTEGKPLAYVVKRYALEFPFESQPGTRHAYSGIGTDVAARVLELAAKRSRNDLFVTEVSKPLGMTRTFYRDVDSVKRIGRMPIRYYRNRDGVLLVSPERPIPERGAYSASGGTIISTAPDLARWLLMIRNGGRHEGKAFLAPENVAEMLAGVPRSSNARGGFAIRKRDAVGKALVVGHTGSSGTNCWIDFKHDIIGIMLTQTSGKHNKAFRIELEEQISDCIEGQSDPDPRHPER